VLLIERRDEPGIWDACENCNYFNLPALLKYAPRAEYSVVGMGREDDGKGRSSKTVLHEQSPSASDVILISI
jgi:hypothetical protein